MELLKSMRSRASEEEHWVSLDDVYTPPDLLPLDNFRQKLERALNDLGRVDYTLQESINCLRADVTDTHDRLHAQITGLAEPELNRAMGELADALARTMDMVDGVLAGKRMRRQ